MISILEKIFRNYKLNLLYKTNAKKKTFTLKHLFKSKVKFETINTIFD